MNLSLVLLFASLICAVNGQKAVVFWHGMGDFGKDPGLMELKEVIEQTYPGAYVRSIMVGSNSIEDIENSYLMNVNKQIDLVCTELSSDPRLQEGFHAVGFSQGGQFLRGLVQRCSTISVSNLISVGGQHQGVFGFPKCPPSLRACEYAREMVAKGAYESFVQNHIVQAEYWHDPLKEEEYVKKSVFLADINQENAVNTTYKHNLMRLENFVMVKFNNDSIVVPRISEWFGFYSPGQDTVEFQLEQSPLYVQDKLGLRVMQELGRLHFISLDGDHLHFTLQWFKQTIVLPWLS